MHTVLIFAPNSAGFTASSLRDRSIVFSEIVGILCRPVCGIVVTTATQLRMGERRERRRRRREREREEKERL